MLSLGFARITFAGPTLDRFADPGLDQRIKLLLPAPDGTLDAVPFSADWYAVWRELPEARRPVIRTYTTRAVRPGEVDVDFVLHEPCGPAGRFAQRCAIGDEVLLLGPNTGAPHGGGIDFRLPVSAERVLIAGDETALPAIARTLDGLPEHVAATAVVEVPHAEDAKSLPDRDGVELRVLVRGPAPSGALLHDAARDAALAMRWTGDAVAPEDVDVYADGGMLWEVPGDGAVGAADGPSCAWIAGEAGMVRALRRTLVGEVGMDRSALAFLGYWRRGRSEGA